MANTNTPFRTVCVFGCTFNTCSLQHLALLCTFSIALFLVICCPTFPTLQLWQLIPHLCSSSQFCIDAMATRSYGFSRTTMCRMRSSTPRHSSPPHDTHLTSGSSCVFFSCPLRLSNFVSSQNPRKIEDLLTAVPLHRRPHCRLMKQSLKVNPWRLPSSPTFFLSPLRPPSLNLRSPSFTADYIIQQY